MPGKRIVIRLFPGGGTCGGASVSRSGSVLEIELDQAVPELDQGGLVEVTTEKEVILGPVLARAGDRVRVEIEHAIDRARLAQIQETWGRG